MKRTILITTALFFVAAHASDNPFDIKENFGKLDKDQTNLLQELQKVDKKIVKTVVKKKIIQPKKAVKVPVVTTSIRGEAEKREVAAYEKQRTMKLQKEAEEALALEKKQLAEIELEKTKVHKKVSVVKVEKAVALQTIEKNELALNREHEKAEAKKAADKAYQDAVNEMRQDKRIKEKTVQKVFIPKAEEIEVIQTIEKNELAIDREREKAAEKEAADKAYAEAVREMSQED